MAWRSHAWRWIIRPLGLGAATTIAVAWGLAAWLPQRGWEELHVVDRGFEFKTFGEHGYTLMATEFRTVGAARRVWDRRQFGVFRVPPFLAGIKAPEGELWDYSGKELRGLEWGEFERVRMRPLEYAVDGCEHATGWPALAGWYSLVADASAGIQVRGGVPIDVANPFRQTHVMRAIPLRPIWAGLAIDSIFYGAIWCGVFAAVGMTRRVWRRRRGCCVRCGYDRRGLEGAPACPECGFVA